jgi:histidine ammonia-lyase
MNACQALDFRTAKSSATIEAAKANYRQVVPHLDGDRYLHDDLRKSEAFIAAWKL